MGTLKKFSQFDPAVWPAITNTLIYINMKKKKKKRLIE